MSSPIPQPPRLPFIGNVTSIEGDVPARSWKLLADTYGPVYQLDFFGTVVVFVNNHELVNQVSDEKRFKKIVGRSLNEVRSLVGDGLFTAHNEEPNWGIAHRLLMPAFGTVAIRDMFDDMVDICGQLIDKWERFGSEYVITPAEDFTKVALDTIALCSMSYRLNSFYTEGQPPFANAMVDWLKESYLRTNRPALVQALMRGSTQKYQADIDLMTDIANKIVADRKANPIEKKDLLNTMLLGKDPKTGQGLDDDTIVKNLLTFLIAGHETSSGTLTFATYYLLKNPETLQKAREEVDEVLGDQPAQVQDLSKLQYINAILRETLRLSPPAVIRMVAPVEDTTLSVGDKKYDVKAGQIIAINAMTSQHDPAVYGPDADEFKPERMLEKNFLALPPNSWQPFGYGMRACIGRPFAWQEMLLILSSIIQRFDIFMVDPSYTLQLQQALTVKPKDFNIRVAPRAGKTISRLGTGVPSRPPPTRAAAQVSTQLEGAIPMHVLYGSNGGTAEAFAQRIASDAPSYGFRPTIGTLDSAKDSLPTTGPVILVAASYEGEPADNAAQFFAWLSHMSDKDALTGVRYAVFGCGNRDWVATYQRVPRMVDELLEGHGATRLLKREEGDSSQGDFFQVFEDFQTGLWEALSKEFQTTKSESHVSLEVKTIEPRVDRAKALRQPDAAYGTVVENRVLTRLHTHGEKRHIEFELPEEMSYSSGDYLSVIPHNPPRDVHRVLARFGLSQDQDVVLSSTGPTPLPVDRPVNIVTLLSGYVELSQPATTRDIQALFSSTTNEDTVAKLQTLLNSHQELVFKKRMSILDILESYPSIKLSLGAFLHLLPPMRVRQYSISSSPLWNPSHVTLTLSVVTAPAFSGRAEPFLGVASNYIASLRPGDRVQLAVRASATAFHAPVDPQSSMVMFAAGSGLAPMRGFIQERAVQKASGREVGKMLLFFGCRDPEDDYLYSDAELGEWIEQGVVDVRPAFSRRSEESFACRYVQDRIWHDRVEVDKAYQEGAYFYTCGSSKVASGVRETLTKIVATINGLSPQDAASTLERISKGRYATDIFD